MKGVSNCRLTEIVFVFLHKGNFFTFFDLHKINSLTTFKNYRSTYKAPCWKWKFWFLSLLNKAHQWNSGKIPYEYSRTYKHDWFNSNWNSTSALTYQIVVAHQISVALGTFSEINNGSPYCLSITTDFLHYIK